ncbi:helix-turn-helix domain-containing protein [Rhodococcus sp. JT-3]|uniref:helix-turn-helix domain-containing protein n=1 Tax=Rhodococcus sp. JT-3 TaxID=1973213 RepID=UPI0013038399|nr:helix-turn-helix domain-containing protein [Rhodococcus sp. JT-3]
MSGLMDIDAPVPITLKEAAALVGISYSGIKHWTSRGLLKPMAVDERGYVVDRNEVFELAERMRRRRRLRS